jgi:hypothetical protein
MKISNVGSTRSTGPAGNRKVSGKGGAFAEHLRDTESVKDGAAAVDTPPVGGMEGVLAAQEVPGALDGRSRKQTVDRGEMILDRLDQLRIRLIDGAMPKAELVELAQLVRARRRASDDPRLTAIIEEIELRAEVEIAKLTRDA